MHGPCCIAHLIITESPPLAGMFCFCLLNLSPRLADCKLEEVRNTEHYGVIPATCLRSTENGVWSMYIHSTNRTDLTAQAHNAASCNPILDNASAGMFMHANSPLCPNTQYCSLLMDYPSYMFSCSVRNMGYKPRCAEGQVPSISGFCVYYSTAPYIITHSQPSNQLENFPASHQWR